MLIENLEETIDKLYNLDSLLKLYKEYLNPFDKTNALKLDQKSVDFSTQKAQKKELTRIFAEVISNKPYFDELKKSLPVDVIKVFTTLVWDGGKRRVEDLEKNLELKILLPNATNSKSTPISTHYQFFCVEKNSNANLSTVEYRLYLPDIIRQSIKQNFDLPEFYNLIPFDEIGETEYVHEDKSRILNYLPFYYNYVNGDNVNFSKQEKPSKASTKTMKEYFDIKEFFQSEDKELELLKTELIAVFFKDLKISAYANNAEMLKDIVANFANDSSNYFLDTLLNHVKGKSDIRTSEEYIESNKKVKASILTILKNIPTKWVSVQNIVSYAFYRDIFLELFSLTHSKNNLYFDEMKKASNSYSYAQKSLIKEDIYNEIVIEPLIKGVLFLFSALGIVDIAYNLPRNNNFRQKNQEYLSVFDELKFVKLNDLGSFVFGYNNDFVTFESEEKEEFLEVKLEEDFLLLKVTGNDKYKILFIESFSEKISDGLYKVTNESFLSGCSTTEDIETKIKTFKSDIEVNPPKIWTNFFYKLTTNAGSLLKKDIAVYKINEQDPALINIISSDEVVRKHILRAEGSYLLISETNFPIVKKRLQEFGYFIF